MSRHFNLDNKFWWCRVKVRGSLKSSPVRVFMTRHSLETRHTPPAERACNARPPVAVQSCSLQMRKASMFSIQGGRSCSVNNTAI